MFHILFGQLLPKLTRRPAQSKPFPSVIDSVAIYTATESIIHGWTDMDPMRRILRVTSFLHADANPEPFPPVATRFHPIFEFDHLALWRCLGSPPRTQGIPIPFAFVQCH